MISPERLRRFPHCATAPEDLLKAVAMLSEERSFKAGERLFEEGNVARHLIVVDEGEIDVVYTMGDMKRVVVDTLVAGDLLGWSALLEPYKLSASAVGRNHGKLIAIEAEGLRRLCDENPRHGYELMKQVAITLRSRLTATRVQLAAQLSEGE